MRTPNAEQRVSIEVTGAAQPPLSAVHHSTIREIAARLLTKFFARPANDIKAYEEVVVPFLDRMIKQFPVAGYPSNAPSPALDVLLKDWSIVVRYSDRFERVYPSGTSGKTLLLEFQDV